MWHRSAYHGGSTGDTSGPRPVGPAVVRDGLVLVVAGAIVLSGCSGSSSPVPPGPRPTPSPTVAPGRPGGTLQVVGTTPSAQLDPGAATDDASLLVGRLVYRQLYSYGASSPVAVPDLAAGPPEVADGGTTVTIRLRGDVRWNVPAQRGISSADAVRGLKRLCLPGRRTPLRASLRQVVVGYAAACSRLSRLSRATDASVDAVTVAGVAAVGDDRMQLRLLEPVPDLTALLAQPAASPVPAEIAPATAGASLSTDPTALVGDGPYRFGTPDPGEVYRLTRNPAWDPASDPLRQAFVDRVVVRGGLTAAAVVAQVSSGAADLSWETDTHAANPVVLQPAASAAAGNVPGAVPRGSPSGQAVVASTPARSVALLLTGSRGPAKALLRRALVRSAVAACLDRSALVTALGPDALPLPGLVPDAVAEPSTAGAATSGATSGEPSAPGSGAASPTSLPAPTPTPTALSSSTPTSSPSPVAETCRAGLAAAGVPRGTVLHVLTATGGAGVLAALAKQLAPGGVTLAATTGRWDLQLLSEQPSPAGVRGELAPLLDPAWAGAPGLPAQPGLLRPAGGLALLESALATSSASERGTRTAAVVEVLQQDAAIVPLAEQPTVRPVGPHLSVAPVLRSLGNVDPANAALDVTRPRTDAGATGTGAASSAAAGSP